MVDTVLWWRHQMETTSALLAICAGNSPVTDEFPAQRPVTRSFDVFFDLLLYKLLSKQWWGWQFETPSRPSWRHRNDINRQKSGTSTVDECAHVNVVLENETTHLRCNFMPYLTTNAKTHGMPPSLIHSVKKWAIPTSTVGLTIRWDHSGLY